MGLLDSASRILLIAKADTTDATRKMKKLKGTQRELAKSQLEAQEKVNAGLSKQIVSLGKLAIGVGVAVAAFKGLGAAANRYGEIARAQFASQGADISAIQKAFGGLITEFEATSFAASAMNTDFALTQKEMETVGKAFVSLRAQGNNATMTFEKLTKAIVENNVEGLKKFGINIKESGGTVKAHTRIMAALSDEAKKAGEAQGLAGDETQKAAVKWRDALDDLVVALGKIGEALAPVVGALADIVDGLGSIPGLVSDIIASRERANKFDELKEKKATLARLKAGGPAADVAAVFAQGNISRAQGAFEARDTGLGSADTLQRASEGLFLDPESKRILQIRAAEAAIAELEAELKKAPPPAKPPGGSKKRNEKGGSGVSVILDAFGNVIGGEDFTTKVVDFSKIFGKVPGRIGNLRPGAIEAAAGAGAQSLALRDLPFNLQRLAGKTTKAQKDEFTLAAEQATGLKEKDFDDKTKKLVEGARATRKQLELTKSVSKEFSDIGTEAMGAFAKAGQAGFQAWIDGSKSAGEAIKEALGGALTSIAVEMFGKSLLHGAEAIAALATGNLAGAATHGKAAGLFAAGAIVTGGLAKQFGGKGAPSGGGGGGGSGPGAGAPIAPTSTSNITVFVGEDFGENVQQNGQRLARAFRRAREAGGDDDSFFLDE